MHIVQIVPIIGPGGGVSGVAWHLEHELRALGHTVESFTYGTARRRAARRMHRPSLFRAFALFRRMVWFTIFGTARARRFLAERPGAISICHNNAMVGDVYVNHGVVSAAMRARGHGLWRMLRNPTHPFTFVRDYIRYRSRIHRAVVALSASEADTLRRTYGQVRPPIAVIPNGVDLDRFRPPTLAERAKAREVFSLDDDDRVVLFIGHEFERKGLNYAIEALAHAPTVMLLVVGGDAASIPKARALAEKHGVAERVLFVGRRHDLPLFFAASDIFVLPSAYEANALVVLEALACGLPVVATPVGFAPELVHDGENGFLVDQDPVKIGNRFEELAAGDPIAYRGRARASVQDRGWDTTAKRYVALLERIASDSGASSARTATSATGP
ncbi:glycosyltransferase family 4 protein [Agromyces sp. Marseille-P2726]|uniref:glycosyltransferase family 4 protein n=1 Tax=Agromyces sp. Marseille-P2726 TaxID=2709132 RepID=UPI001570ABA0|nr:glycosyltransferase family 4 protein [Agromyces sp. Marseille-P2726]